MSEAPTTFWTWLQRTARLWGFLAFVLLVAVLFRAVVLPFVLAGLVAYVLAPVVRLLSGLRFRSLQVPRFVAVIAVYAVVLGLLGVFFTSFVPRLSADFTRIVREAPAFWKKAREQYVPSAAAWVAANFKEEPSGEGVAAVGPPAPAPKPRFRVKPLKGGELELEVQELKLEVAEASKGRWTLRVPQAEVPRDQEERVADSINRYLTGFVAKSETQLRHVLGIGQKLLQLVFSAITTFILVFMISAFLLIDAERILRWFRNLVPERYGEDMDNVIGLIDRGLSGAVRGQLLICVVNGVLTWVGLTIFGIKYTVLLALLAATMSLIPIFGSILSSIPIVVVALVSGSDGLALLKGVFMLGWIIGIHLVEANLLNPKIMGRAARIHPVLVIFAVVAGERTYGATGALLGVPLASAVQAMFLYLRGRLRESSTG